ncbi:hypothetical protein E3N88_15096 [Mikania micrantha]|uniref:PB1 domain-containing protein n=1 Tax=Mikania micrantha TaxID=192012 RepID=A0A5N6NX70_9ASTR|nr:hypothetical protein E3N88_15096 [Mikania micrantha]
MTTINLDFDSFCSFDQVFFSDSPSFVLSQPDQSLSPLWTFSDEDRNKELNDGDDKLAGNAALTSFVAAHRLRSDTDDPDQAVIKKPLNIHIPMPILEVNPSKDQESACIIKERMTMALRYIKELIGGNHVLAQIWVPFKNKNRHVLTTTGQPFVIDPNSNGLHQYRMASLMYVFPLDGKTDGALEILGRVFRLKLPEWSPNVQYYSEKEYQRLNHALNYDVRGTLAVPVFEPSKQSCVGVLELVMTTQKINYAAEVDNVCRALEAANLRGSSIVDDHMKVSTNENQQQALAEILEVMTVVCETYNLPLAQTWVPCRHLAYEGGFKKSCSSFDGSCVGQVCMSTTDVAFYVVDAHMWGFRDACSEHHLQKGQGVVGRAFATRGSCFCDNVTYFGKTEYPLVHYARLFGLRGSFAICLRSSHTGDEDYILEFFLPTNKDQQTLLGSLWNSMKLHFHSFKVASGEEIGKDDIFVEVVKASGIQLIRLSESGILNGGQSSTGPNAINGNSGKSLSPILKALDKGKKPMVVDSIRRSDRKYKTATIPLPLEVVEKQFGKTMKEAAQNLHVSLSTLKRKCNALGISEWPGPNLLKRKANDSCIIQKDTKEEDNELIQDISSVNMNKNTLTIKAEYAGDMLKFHLPILQATFVNVENEIGMRFQLSVGTYKIKYLDEDGDWVSLISDEGISDCVKSSRKLDQIVVRLQVLPSTQPISTHV